MDEEKKEAPEGQEVMDDSCRLDLFVDLDGRPVRPWLSVSEDVWTRQIVSWHITERPVFDIMNCVPYRPWSKLVERFFGKVSTQFSRHLPGYCGSSPMEHPEGFDARKQLEQGMLLKFEDFVDLWKKWVDGYNSQVHGSPDDTSKKIVTYGHQGYISREIFISCIENLIKSLECAIYDLRSDISFIDNPPSSEEFLRELIAQSERTKRHLEASIKPKKPTHPHNEKPLPSVPSPTDNGTHCNQPDSLS